MAKITIVGRGLDPSKHLSLAGINALRRADKVFGIESEKNFWKQLEKQFQIKQIEDLSPLYRNNEIDTKNYQEFIGLIFDISSKYEEIVLLVAGHPRVGVSFVDMLQRAYPQIDLEIIEGISSFDVMLNYLALDPLEAGTAILDANRLLLFQYQMEPSICYFIYHICSVGTSRTNYKDPSKDNQVYLLKDYLLNFYSPTKIIHLCRMSNGREQQSIKTSLLLTELDTDLSIIDFSTTLFIPAEEPKNLDFKYLKLIKQA